MYRCFSVNLCRPLRMWCSYCRCLRAVRTGVGRRSERALDQSQHHHHALGLHVGQQRAAGGGQRRAVPAQERLRRQQQVRLADGERSLQRLRAELQQRQQLAVQLAARRRTVGPPAGRHTQRQTDSGAGRWGGGQGDGDADGGEGEESRETD